MLIQKLSKEDRNVRMKRKHLMQLRLCMLQLLRFYLGGEYVGAVPDLIELGCSQDSDVSVRPSTQLQFLAVSYSDDTRC